MRETLFEHAYPHALRAAQVWTAAAVHSGAIPGADRDDLLQESLMASWRALALFDPQRASVATFVELVVRKRICSAVRSRRRRPVLQLLDLRAGRGADSSIDQLELRIDVARVLTILDETGRRLATLLMENSASEASRVLGTARSTVYEHINRLRPQFVAAGLGPVGSAHGVSRTVAPPSSKVVERSSR